VAIAHEAVGHLVDRVGKPPATGCSAGLFTILTISGGLAFPILFLGIFTAELDVVGSSALFANFCTPFGPFLT
jgi:hypothetical protein